MAAFSSPSIVAQLQISAHVYRSLPIGTVALLAYCIKQYPDRAAVLLSSVAR